MVLGQVLPISKMEWIDLWTRSIFDFGFFLQEAADLYDSFHVFIRAKRNRNILTARLS